MYDQPLPSAAAERNAAVASAKAGLKISRRFTRAGEDPYASTAYDRRTSIIRNTDGSVVFEMKDLEVPSDWSQIATDILAQKYFRKAGVPKYDENGNPILNADGTQSTGGETSIRQVAHRMAGCWRYWGEKHGYFASTEDAKAFYDELVYMLVHQMAAPNSPQWFNTGLHWAYGINGPAQGHYYVDAATREVKKSEDAYTRPQPHACFIQKVEDDLVGEGGIMDLWTREARLFKYGSGTGTNFSNLRGKGEKLSGGGTSSGLMSFLKIGDSAAGAIKSGGTTRRAAKMVCLDLDHPDIEDFINWKVKEEKKVAAMIAAGYPSDYEGEAYQTVAGQNANNSVRVPAAFFDALDHQQDWGLRWRTNGKVTRTVPAQKLWDEIGQAAWSCADPGVQYDTTINEWHTCPQSGPIRASNPCSEYMFLDDTACNLASINLLKFYDPQTHTFDVDGFTHATHIWTIVLEISVLMAQFPSREIARLSFEFRTLGLGYANIGSLLMTAGIPYDSPRSNAIAAAITALMTGESYRTSAEMAQHLGAFPGYEKNRADMLRVMRNHRRAAYAAPESEYEGLTVKPQSIRIEDCPAYLLRAAQKAWDAALNEGERWGFRNAQTTCIAPTGTIGLVMDCDTTGIEPDFALVKFKKLAGGGYFKIVNGTIAPALLTLGYSPDQIRDILAYVGGTATLSVHAPINAASLQKAGFTAEEVAKIEAGLPHVLDIGSAIALAGFGPTTYERLGIAAEDYAKKDFSLLRNLGFTKDDMQKTTDIVCGTLTVEGAPHLKAEHYPVFDCANKCGRTGTRFIQPMAHVRILSAVQPFVSGSISKTINLPHEATVEEIKDIYYQGWRMGLKANALYRDGCKLSQPLSTKSEQKEEKPDAAAATTKAAAPAQQYGPVRRKMPDERHSLTHKFSISGHEGYITVGMYEDGTPGEIFVTMNKEGSVIAGLLDAFAKSISWSLQYGVPLKALVNTFVHSRFEPSGYTTHPNIRIAKSIVDYLFRWLALKFLSMEDAVAVGLNDMVVEEEVATDQPVVASAAPRPATAAPAPQAAVYTETESVTVTKSLFEPASVIIDTQKDAPVCDTCGAMMVRNGTCYKCLNCGSTSGCS